MGQRKHQPHDRENLKCPLLSVHTMKLLQGPYTVPKLEAGGWGGGSQEMDKNDAFLLRAQQSGEKASSRTQGPPGCEQKLMGICREGW